MLISFSIQTGLFIKRWSILIQLLYRTLNGIDECPNKNYKYIIAVIFTVNYFRMKFNGSAKMPHFDKNDA